MPAPLNLGNLGDEVNMAAVAGMAASNRRLARLGVENVDLSWCEHGCNAECMAQVGRGRQEVTIHGAASPLAAVDALVEKVERLRRQAKRRR